MVSPQIYQPTYIHITIPSMPHLGCCKDHNTNTYETRIVNNNIEYERSYFVSLLTLYARADSQKSAKGKNTIQVYFTAAKY